jgi:hypothetical protein
MEGSAPSSSTTSSIGSTSFDTSNSHFVRIDPINPWSEIRFDLIIPISILYAIVSSLILCPPNFKEYYRRFKEFKRSFE